jgi:hypothetical protein
MAEPNELFAASAAYAGLGNGLYNFLYTEPYTCAHEKSQLPFERVLLVDFSDAALGLTSKGMQSFKRLGNDAAALIDTELRYVDGRSGDEAEKLFAKIGARIRRFVRDCGREVTMVLLTGTRVSETRFKETLIDALGELVAPQVKVEHGSDGDMVFATEKGAAEVAKRRLEGPMRCIWGEDCRSLQAEG